MPEGLGGAGMMSAQQNVMMAFFGAFAGFTAFGTVVASFLVSSNALPRLAALWGAHGVEEAQGLPAGPERDRAMRWARRRRVLVLWSIGGAVAVAALISACGLLTSGLWLYASARGSPAGWKWAYTSAGYLFAIEVGLITLITALTMVAAVLAAVRYGQKTEDVVKSGVQSSTALIEQGG
jgi:hypothetical protein